MPNLRAAYLSLALLVFVVASQSSAAEIPVEKSAETHFETLSASEGAKRLESSTESAPPISAANLRLEEAIRMAVEASPKIQKVASAHREAEWKTTEAFATYMPTLSGSINYLLDKKYVLTDIAFGGNPTSIPQILPTTNYSLNAQYLLFDGGASTQRWRSAQLQETAARQDLEWAQFQMVREVALQYYKTLAAQILMDVANQNAKTLQDHLKDVNLFKKAGISTNYDVLRVEVQVSESQSELLNATDNVENARGHLAEILGLEEIAHLDGSLPVLTEDLVRSVDVEGFVGRSDLKALRGKVEALDRLDSAAQRHWFPKVSLGGIYQYYNNRNDRFDDPENFREAYQVYLALTWSFFDGFASTARAHEAIEQKIQLEKITQQASLKAKQDVGFWKRKFLYFCSVYKSRLADIQKAKESLRLAREGHRVGVRTNTDLLDGEAELYRAQASMINAQVGAVEALGNLELATGKQFYKFL